MAAIRRDPHTIEFYEGLVRKTASMYVGMVEEDFDDICQILRAKIWRALQLYDPSRSRLSVQRYVFSCVRNQCKDLVTKKRRNWLFIEDIAPDGGDGELPLRDRFESRYLSLDDDEVYADVDDLPPTIPSTLTERERLILVHLYRDFRQKEIAAQLGLGISDVSRSVAAIRRKMADWKPGEEEGGSSPEEGLTPPARSEDAPVPVAVPRAA